MTEYCICSQPSSREDMNVALSVREGRLAAEQRPMIKYTREEIKFSKGVMTALKNKINILCDADRDIPARHIYTIEQIERAIL